MLFFPIGPKKPLIWRCWIDFIAFQPNIFFGGPNIFDLEKVFKNAYIMVSISIHPPDLPPSLGNNSHVARVDHSWATRAHFLELSRALFLVLSPWMGAWMFRWAVFRGSRRGLTNFTKTSQMTSKGIHFKKKENAVFCFLIIMKGFPHPPQQK